MDVTILHARPDDIPQMCDLLADLFSVESDFVVDREKQARGLRLLLEGPPGRSLVAVAVHGRSVIGICSVQTVISTAEGGPSGLVEDLVVRRDFRGCGIGRALLGEVLTWCEAQGIIRVQLLADKKNAPALAFYARGGWSGTSLVCLRKSL